MAEMVRVNTRISKVANDWLDQQSEKTGVSKSTLIYLALETYISQQQTIAAMSDIYSKLDEVLERLPDKEQ